MNRKEFKASLNEAITHFAQLAPQSSEEATYYLSKGAMILEEYFTCVRMLAKEPKVAIASLRKIHGHIDDYQKRYYRGKYEKTLEELANQDPWLEDEADESDVENEFTDDSTVEEVEESERDPICMSEYFMPECETDSFLPLQDENTGELIDFCILDILSVDYGEDSYPTYYYAVIPFNPKNEEEEGALQFLRLDEEKNGNQFDGVGDEYTYNLLFKVFKEANEDRYHFEI